MAWNAVSKQWLQANESACPGAIPPAHVDPELSFVREPRSGHSVPMGENIKRAGRAARSHLQHVGVDHGGGHV